MSIDPRDPVPSPGTAASALPRAALRVAWVALLGGMVITGLKFGVFALTNSAAALSDALESIINLVAAGVAIISTWYASRPPDREHPYGHGNIEFVAVGVEGAMIFFAGMTIAFESIRRLISGAEVRELTLGAGLLAGVGVLAAGLAWFVIARGKSLASPTLVADGKHLFTDVLSTIGVVIAMLLVRWTGLAWLDPVFALLLAAFIFITGSRLLRASWHGLMDRADEGDVADILAILDDEVKAERITSYHKVRMRHQGSYHWVDFHIQVDGSVSVHDAHELASAIEHRIERHLGRANATAHIEPAEADPPQPGTRPV